MRGVVQGLNQRLAHDPGRGHRAVKPVAGHHAHDRANAAAFAAHHHAEGVLKLDLGRGVGPVAELVLHSLDEEVVAGPVGPPAGHEEAGEP